MGKAEGGEGHLGDRPVTVLVAVPNTGWIHGSTLRYLLVLMRRPGLTIILPTNVPAESNRNRIVSDFLRGGFDWLLSLDSDAAPMKRDPLDLIEEEKDLMICPAPQWQNTGGYPIFWTAMDAVEEGFKEHPEKRGLQQVDSGGTACFLARRRVFERFRETGTVPFQCTYDEQGELIETEDFTFFMKAKALGFEAWAHYDYPVRHFNELEMIEAATAFDNYNESLGNGAESGACA